MNKFYQFEIWKKPLGNIPKFFWIVVLSIFYLSNPSLIQAAENGTSAWNDPLGGCTLTAPALDLQPKECDTKESYTVTAGEEYAWYKVPVKLTERVVINAHSDDFNVAIVAFKNCTDATEIGIVDPVAGDAELALDFTTGPNAAIDAGDYILVKVKFYHTSYGDVVAGETFEICAFEPALTCGETFVDSGKAAGDYSANEDCTVVFCSDDPNARYITLDFTQFDLQAPDANGNCLDYMQIYDGEDLVEIDGETKFCGSDLLGETITATDHSGCLTAVFKSNGDADVGAGWFADVGCTSCNITIDSEISACNMDNVNIEVTAIGGISNGDLEYAIRGYGIDKGAMVTDIVNLTSPLDWQDSGLFLSLPTGTGSGVGGAIEPIDFYRIIVRDKNNTSCRKTKRVRIRDLSDPLTPKALLAELLNPANVTIVETSADCEGKQGMAVVSVDGGKAPYMVTLGGITIEGEGPFKFNDLEVPLNGDGLPLADGKVFTVTIMDALGCSTQKTFRLKANCKTLDCEAGDIVKIPAPNMANTNNPTFICTDNGKNIVLEDIEEISFANAEDTLRVYDGQGVVAANLIAEYHQNKLPTSSLYSSSACITVLIINASPVDRGKIDVKCAECDFTVDVMTTNASCMSAGGVPNPNGIVKFTIAGGTHPNQYSVRREGDITETWVEATNGELSIDNLPDGDYYFFIRDNWKLCVEKIPVTIGIDKEVEILRAKVTNETCIPGDDGKVDVRVTGGSGVYLYSIDGGINFQPALAIEDANRPDTFNFEITGLEGNTSPAPYEYTLVVKDANHPDFTDDCIQATRKIRVYDDCYAKTCDGVFYDTPGDEHVSLSNERYGNEDQTYIICPDVPNNGDFVTVKFQYIRINRFDTLRVYDSAGDTGESLLLDKLTRAEGTDGDLSTSEDDLLITATNASGCLTFVLDRDLVNSPTNNSRGWIAMIQCFKACGMEEASSPAMHPETCKNSEDGTLELSVDGGSGDYTYNLFRINDPSKVDTLDGKPQFNANGTIKLTGNTDQGNVDTLPAQTDGLFTSLRAEQYVYIIEDNIIPNCRITGFVVVERLPELKLHVQSPGLACEQDKASITVKPKGGSGEYILKAPDNTLHNMTEGDEKTFTGFSAVIGGYEFILKDARNTTACYVKEIVPVTNNCRVTCYDNELFSSSRPYDGPTGYENYEHFVVTYCPWVDGGTQKSVKATFSEFDTELDLDELTIYNGIGTVGDVIGKYSGTNSPGEVISTALDGCMTLEFRSNLTNNSFGGFKAKMTCVEECKLSATSSATNATFCWDERNGDKNGSITVVVDNPISATEGTYQFRLFDETGVAISGWKNDNNDQQGNFDDADDIDADGLDTGDGIIGTYRFDSLAFKQNGPGDFEPQDYTVKVRIKGNNDCRISLDETVGVYKALNIEADVTNVNCEGAGGKVCLSVTGGSGQYRYTNTNFTMYDGNPCYENLGFDEVVSYTVEDIVTGCTAQIQDIQIGSDCVEDDFCDIDGYDFFDDNAGGTDLYDNDMDERWIFCATRPDKFIQIDFSKFKTEDGVDIMTIKDGDGDGPVIGTYSGENSPGLVRSVSPSGCLTVLFESNDVVTKLGWEANVSCFYCPSDFEITGGPATCDGHNGSVNVTATASGYTDFIYSLNSDFTNAQDNGNFTGLSGEVTVYATIGALQACRTSWTINEKLAYSLETTNAQCGQANGSLTVNASGGSGDYEYAINDGDFLSDNTFTGLAPGSYALTIKDGDCTKTTGFYIGNTDDGDPVSSLAFNDSYPGITLSNLSSGDTLYIPNQDTVPIFDANLVDVPCGYTATFEDFTVYNNGCPQGLGGDRVFRCVWTATNAAGNTLEIVLFIKVECPIQNTPDVQPNFTFGNTSFQAGQSRMVIINIIEINDATTNDQIQFFLPASSGFTYEFDQAQTSATIYGPESVNNPDWAAQDLGTGLLFTCTKPIPGNSRSRIGIRVTADVSGSKASMTVNITANSGGEDRTDNNLAALSQSVQN